MRTQFARQARRDGFLEEEPNMSAAAGTRAFECHGHIHAPARLNERACVLLPMLAVKISREEKTGFVQQHGINAHDKIAAQFVAPGKMPANHLIGDRKKAAIGTIGAFDSRFLTDTWNPFIAASRRVTGFPGFAALEPSGINIFPAAK